MKTESVFFARNTSGVVRAFRARDVFIFNTLGFALGLVVSLTPSFLALQQPSAGILETLSIGFVACLLNGFLYAEIAGLMPRSGGDYVFLSRVLSPAVGFSASWGLTWSQLFGIGAYASWTVSTALAPGLKILGQLNHSPFIEATAAHMASSPLAISVLTLLLLAAVFSISLLGLVALRRILILGFAVALVGTFIIGASMFTNSPENAQIALSSALKSSGSSLDSILLLFRQSHSAAVQPTRFFAAFLALPVGYWAYLGFTYSVYLGSEVRQPRRSQFFGILSALIFGYISYMLLLGQYYHLIGREGVAALAYAERTHPQLLPVSSSFMLVIGSIAPRGFIGYLGVLSFSVWYFLLLIVMVQVCARNVFAWSLDKIVPRWLTNVSARRAVPRNGIIVVVCIGGAFGLLVSYGLINFINYVALFVTCYLLTGIASTILPWRRPDLIIKANDTDIQSRFVAWRLILLGIANTLIFAFTLVTALVSTDFSGVSATPWPTVFLIMIYGAGLFIFWFARHRTPLLDRELRVQLPPE